MLHWFDSPLTRAIQFHIDSFEYARQVFSNLGIPEADDAITLLLEPKLSFVISLGGLIIVMMSAVQFNNEMLGWTKEVDHIRTDRGLTPEVRAIYRELFQGAPQRALVRCRIGSESFGRCSAYRC